MTTMTTKTQPSKQRTAKGRRPKPSHARLLDMLSGWSQFAQSDSTPDSPGMPERIEALYKEAGQLALYASTIRIATDEEVRAFVIDKVVPLLLEH